MKAIVIVDERIPELETAGSLDVIPVNDYLNGNYKLSQLRYSRIFEVINLCRQSDYLSRGYYSSLLAQARGEAVIPSVDILLALNWKRRYKPILKEMNALITARHLKKGKVPDSGSFLMYFGICQAAEFRKVASVVHEYFPAPALEVHYRFEENICTVDGIELLSVRDIWKDGGKDAFIEALGKYAASKLAHKPKSRTYRKRLAVLVNEKEKLPPSNPRALANFVRLGTQMGLEVDLIGKKDADILSEYDGLFIRETTNIDHHTFAFAQDATLLGIPVIDHPDSIVKCSNKVYLHELFRYNGVSTLPTHIIDRKSVKHLPEKINFPLVIKIPDGSFGQGVHKVKSVPELQELTDRLFEKSDLLLAQEYMTTPYDWRVGILNYVPLFICKYYMARNHWQIVKKEPKSKDGFIGGKVECYPVDKAPSEILDLALRGASLIGDGLYGVDIKEGPDGPVIMEINDNPNIDAGYEDTILKDDLYRIVLGDFLRRMNG